MLCDLLLQNARFQKPNDRTAKCMSLSDFSCWPQQRCKDVRKMFSLFQSANASRQALGLACTSLQSWVGASEVIKSHSGRSPTHPYPPPHPLPRPTRLCWIVRPPSPGLVSPCLPLSPHMCACVGWCVRLPEVLPSLVNKEELPSIGPKMMKTAQKDSWML